MTDPAASTAFGGATGNQPPAAAPAPAPAPAPGDPPADPPAAPSGDRTFLPESYREDPRFAKFNSAEDLAKSYLGAESLISKSIRIPSKDAGDKQRADFYEKLESVDGVVRIPSNPEDTEGFDKLYNKMGRPEKAEDYSVGSDEQKALYHQLGLSESQARALNTANERAAQELTDKHNEQVKEAGDKLRDELGDGFDRAMKNSQLAALQFFGEDFLELMKTDPLFGNNVELIKGLAEVGDKMGEKKIPLNSSADTFNLNKQEVEQQIADLRANEAYQKKEDWAVQKMRMLYQKLEKE